MRGEWPRTESVGDKICARQQIIQTASVHMSGTESVRLDLEGRMT